MRGSATGSAWTGQQAPRTHCARSWTGAPNADDDAPARLAAPEPRQHKETTMALAQYRSRRDSERSCPWFHTEEQLEAIAEQAYDEEATNSTTERAPKEAAPPAGSAASKKVEAGVFLSATCCGSSGRLSRA